MKIHGWLFSPLGPIFAMDLRHVDAAGDIDALEDRGSERMVPPQKSLPGL